MKRKKYNTGGPLDSIPARPMPTLPLNTAPKLDLTGLGPTTFYAPNNMRNTVQTPVYTNYAHTNSSKSKSKDRFREHEFGGFLQGLSGVAGLINPAAGAATAGVGSLVSFVEALNKKNKVISASPGNYKSGGGLTKSKAREILHDGSVHGHKLTDKQRRFFAAQAFESGGQMDQQLSDSSFQVKGNPSKTDGNFYPQFNAYLDHNEVVKNDFVFSDSIRSPLTGAKFSEEALKIENSSKKAQRKLKVNPTDVHAQNTLMHNEKTSAALAALQETVATKMGLRNSDGSTIQRLQHGGPTNPYPWQDWMTWTPTYDVSAKKTASIPYDPFSPYSLTATNNTPSLGSGHGTATNPSPAYKGSSSPLPAPIQTTPNPSVPAARKPTRVTKPLSTAPISPVAGPIGNATTDLPFDQIPFTRPPQVPFSGVDQVTSESRTNGIPLPTSNSTASGTTDSLLANDTSNGKQRFSFGDYLQLGAFAGELLPLIGGSEKEKPNLDTTFISKEHYDARQALQQNQRNFSNVASSINTSSETLRRALLAQLDATKTNRDNQVISQYQTMNNQAQTRYEDRLANQRRYNVGQQNYTNDLNARNRASYRYAVQNAFESVSNLGQAFNQRDYQQKQLNLLKGRYGDVYANVIANLMGQ